jgi:hypothetical protein
MFLESLIARGAVVPEGSSELDRVYDGHQSLTKSGVSAVAALFELNESAQSEINRARVKIGGENKQMR